MNLDNAIKLATDAHAGQIDKGGQPYILHPLRIMLAMKTDEERIVAVLHDVVEDTAVSADDLYWVHGFKMDIVKPVCLLTRTKGENYFDYIERLSVNPIARAVKIADLRDNLCPTRALTGSKAETREQKYRLALYKLMGEER